MSLTQFSVSSNTVTGPYGPFTAYGVGLEDNEVTSSTAGQITTLLPGTNFVRLGITSLTAPLSTTLDNFITTLTNEGIVVEIEDHDADAGEPGNIPPTGTTLTAEENWYASLASHYAGDPYVWFGTMNEPSNNSNTSTVSAQEEDIYNAIRGASNNNPILLEQYSGFESNDLVSADFSSMTSVIWDTHVYGWESGYSTNQSTVTSDMNSQISNAQSITTSEGTVPVIMGEYGPSTDGSTMDANANEVITAVQGSDVGSSAWNWNIGADAVANSAGTSLTSFGSTVASYNAAGNGGGIAASPSGSNISAGSGQTLIDASGNIWGINNSGQVEVNDTADIRTGNVIQLASVGGDIYQENDLRNWWSTTGPGASWTFTGGAVPFFSTDNVTAATISQTINTENITFSSGNHSMNLTGSNDIILAGGGTDTLTDNSSGNILFCPTAGNGKLVLTNTSTAIVDDLLNLYPALQATDWDGLSGDLNGYLHVTPSGSNTNIGVSVTAGSSSTTIATLDGVNYSYATVLSNSIT